MNKPSGLRIFISYRREDASGHAGRLYDALAARFGRDRVFMDIDTIDLGAEFAKTIGDAVGSCDVVIALIGRDWLSSADAAGRRRLDNPDDFVRIELESALDRGIHVIPTCVRGAQIPSATELPPSLAPLAGRQGTELRDVAWHDDVGRLTRRLERLSDETGEAEAEPKSPRRSWRPSRKVIAMGVALAAVGGAAAGLAAALGGSGGGGSPGSSGAKGRLLALIPAITRPTCQSISYGEKAALVSLECSGTRLSVTYHLFDSNGVMDGWYIQQRETAGVQPGSGTCTGKAFRGEKRYAAGRYFCFVDTDGEPELFWTDTGHGVGSMANIYTGKGPVAAESLLRQWRCCLKISR